MNGGFSLLLTAAGGWLWGSYLNQIVDRTPRALPGDGESPSPQPTLLKPIRSLCLTCGSPIAWYDNVPILSYLLLRGRCRHCRRPIGRRTLAVETIVPLFLATLHWVFGWRAVASWGVLLVSVAVLGAVWAAERRRPSRLWLLALAAGGGWMAAFRACSSG